MSKAHEGSSLPIKTCLPVDEHTTFLAHYDITDEENLHGIKPIESIATLRPFEGKYGGGIAIEEGTINETTSIRANYVNRMDTTTPSPLPFPSDYGVIYHLQSSNYTGIRFSINNVSAGQTITFSWYVFVKQAGNYAFNLQVDSNISSNRNIGALTNLQCPFPGWYRVERTTTFSNAESNILVRIEAGLTSNWSNNDNSCWITGVQTERKPFATSYVNGSRPPGRLAYEFDTNSWQNFTFMCWTKVSTDRAFRMPGGAWSKWYFSWANNSTNSLRVSWLEDGVQRVLSTPNILEVDCREWNMVGFTYDGTNIHIYMNGKLVRSGTGKFNSPSNSPLGIGTISGNSTSHVLNGIIDEVRIDKIVRTPEEIAQWYHSQAPFFPKGKHRVYL